ncbi:NADPH-dependent FMN reductase [Halalkalibacter oceani]|uniref:NADPH-dependent FMN reductase n=1 Tax=Halalkalibacter oceani TaxID=1653776 RepID=UPI00339472CC
MMKIVGISGTVIGAKPAVLVEQILKAAKAADPTIEIELIDLRQYELEFCDGRPVAHYNGNTQHVIKTVESADSCLIATPIFQASLTGVLKNLFDLLPVTALREKVVGLVATGGTYQHFLVVENQMKPIISYFKGYVAPEFVYAHRDHFNEHNEVIDKDVQDRIEGLGTQLVQMTKALRKAQVK